jgi:hypothetical protein
LLCEVLIRLEAVGLVTNNSYRLRLTQIELGDTVGLSTVHINRVLKGLRERDLVRLDRERITIPDVPRLKAFNGFTPAYLHFGRRNGSDTSTGAEHSTA